MIWYDTIWDRMVSYHIITHIIPRGCELSCVRNVLGAICPGYELSSVWDVLGTSCPGYELSWVRDVLGTSCLGYQLSLVRVVLGTSCPWYHLSWVRIVQIPIQDRPTIWSSQDLTVACNNVPMSSSTPCILSNMQRDKWIMGQSSKLQFWLECLSAPSL